MDHHGPWKLKHILSSKIWWCLALAWDSRIAGVFFCLPNNSKNNSVIETWIRTDVNFPLPMCDKEFLPFPSSPSFPSFPHSRPHQWFWTELRKLGKRFHNLAQASFPAAWVVEVSCFKTLLGHSVFVFFVSPLWMFRLWTWGGKKKSSICSIWVASFMEDLSLIEKKSISISRLSNTLSRILEFGSTMNSELYLSHLLLKVSKQNL